MKFKNTKATKGKKASTSSKRQEFPRNFRIIPEKVSDEFVFLLGLSVILISGLVVSLDLYRNLSAQKEMAAQNSQLYNNLSFWQNEVKTHPNYRDGYFSLALLNFQLKDFGSSKQNLDKALSIDPNFPEGIKLQKLLEKY